MQAKSNERIRVLTVSSNSQNLVLLKRVLGKAGYEVITAAGLEAFDRAMDDKVQVSLALVDITGFDQRIWSRCEQLREGGIPFLLLGSRSDASLNHAGDHVGAASVLIKPLAVKELVSLVGFLVQQG